MTWLQLRDEIEAEFREHTRRENEVRAAVAWHDVHQRSKRREWLRAWRWRQGERGRQRERERVRAYHRRKRAEPGWSAGRNARKRALIAAKLRCPSEAERLRQQKRASNKCRWAKVKADRAAHEKRLAQQRVFRTRHKARLAARRRARLQERKAADPVWFAAFQAKRSAWKAANREYLRQYQRDYRARVKARQQPLRRAA
jgi:hypothetical protein